MRESSHRRYHVTAAPHRLFHAILFGFAITLFAVAVTFAAVALRYLEIPSGYGSMIGSDTATTLTGISALTGLGLLCFVNVNRLDRW